MLALEAKGFRIEIGSLNPPRDAFRHERFTSLEGQVHYPPPPEILKALVGLEEKSGAWQERLVPMIQRHEEVYGASFKPDVRARNALYFSGLFQRLGIQHVHVHFANRATHTALFMKQWAGLPFSFTAHAQDFMVDLGSDELLRELCREAEFVVAVSDFSKALLQEKCPDSADKIFRVYNGITPSAFPGARIGGGPLRIISIGRLIEFKGFHHLIGACGLLRKRGFDFSCTIIGDGPWREILEVHAKEGGIEDRVHFPGVLTQEEVKARFQESDVFALPCIVDRKGASDILPTVIMEAMACGLPVVSTRLVGVPEMVDDGVTGLLAEPGDEKGFADALERLALNRELARQLGEAGRAAAEEKFDQEKTSSQLAEKFGALLPEPSASPEAKWAYLMADWPGRGERNVNAELCFLSESGKPGTEVDLLCCRLSKRFRPNGLDEEQAALLPRIEFLPDAIVAEAEWRQSASEARRILEWRLEFGTALQTEDYLVQGRRALVLSRLVEKRGLRHVHAARSDVALAAWLVGRLSGVPFSVTIEEDPTLPAAIIDRILEDAAFANVCRPERYKAAAAFRDDLGLEKTDSRRRVKVGPVKLSWKGRDPATDPAPLYEAWFSKLTASLR